MKYYLKPLSPKSPYEELIGDYKGPITQAVWGEVGGIPTIMKQRVIRQMGPITRQDIGLELGWAINSVTGRVRELLDMNNICEDGKDHSHKVARSLLRAV